MEAKSFSPLAWYGPGKYANSALNAELESPLVEIADSVFIVSLLETVYTGLVHDARTFCVLTSSGGSMFLSGLSLTTKSFQVRTMLC